MPKPRLLRSSLLIILTFLPLIVKAGPHRFSENTGQPLITTSLSSTLTHDLLLPRSQTLTASPTNIPLPSADRFPLQYALAHGWSVSLHVYSYLYPVNSACSRLTTFFSYIQAYALAQMLQNTPPDCRFRLRWGELGLGMGMHPQSTVSLVDWSVVYAFATYMLGWVRRGFCGNGGLYLRHESGILLGVTVENQDSQGTEVNTVWPDDECE